MRGDFSTECAKELEDRGVDDLFCWRRLKVSQSAGQ